MKAVPDGMISLDNQIPIPSRQLSQGLIDFALDELGWLISIVPPSFKAQHDQVWQEFQVNVIRQAQTLDLPAVFRTKPAWSALYLSILAVAALYLRADRAQSSFGLSADRKMTLAKFWFRASVNVMLDRGACMIRPSLEFLQAFCVLTLLTQPFE